MPLGRVGTSLCALLLCAVVSTAREARAQVDMTGPWFAQVFVVFFPMTIECTLEFMQTGTDLAITGNCSLVGMINVSGTIDPMTGEFAGAGTAGGACPTVTFSDGTASLDGTTFFVQFQCSGSLPVLGGIYGYRCGNGVIEAGLGEICDDANRQSGDCCSAACQFEPVGQSCFPTDNNFCTDDVCDGAGTCAPVNGTGPCSDGNQCTTGDTCMDGDCLATTLPDGSACDDFNICTAESCQAGACVAADKPDGTPCDDIYACTAGDACLAGMCILGPPRVCPACQRCQSGNGCLPEPYSVGCQFDSKSFIQLKNTDPDSIKWKWSGSETLELADFGDPLTATQYEFCVFDEYAMDPITGRPKLLFAAALPAGSSWKQTGSGFRFKSLDKMKVRLKEGVAGRSKILIKAKGAAHSVEYLPPLDILVSAYLRTAQDVEPQRCFSSIYTPPLTSTSTQYKAINPIP